MPSATPSSTSSQAASDSRPPIAGGGRSLSRKSSQGKMTNPATATTAASRRCPATTAVKYAITSASQMGPFAYPSTK
jgi:hypothetical protein